MPDRILIIEDNLLNLELVTDLLEAGGYMVEQARAAKEGLRMARASMPDLVLMDLSLPGMDGLAATQVLRADPATRRLAIVALTAHAMKGDEEKALRAGCDAYLAKPIDTRAFLQQISGFISALKTRQTAPDIINL